VGASPEPSCLVCPSFSWPDAVGTSPRVQHTPAYGDAVGQEAHRTCCEWLWQKRLKRLVDSDLELMCSRVTSV
jgi:hypothetical protein